MPRVDRDKLHRQLLTDLREFSQEYRTQAAKAADEICRRYERSKKKSVNVIIKEVLAEAALSSDCPDVILRAMAHGYGVAPEVVVDNDIIRRDVMNRVWTGDGMTLSERLYANRRETERLVRDAITASNARGDALIKTARKLYDGYGHESVIPQAKLPEYLARVEREAHIALTGGDLAEFKKALAVAKGAVKKLKPSTPLRAAYRQMLDAAQTGKPNALERAVRVALEEKSRYHAERIARTEAARAYYDGFMARNMNDPDVVAFKWELSSGHPKPDICDTYAEQDLYGLGAGVYPKDKLPALPAHPHCLCHISEVYEGEVVGAKTEPTVNAEQEKIKALDLEIQAAQKEIDELMAQYQFVTHSEKVLRETAADYRARRQIKTAEMLEKTADARHKIDQLTGKIANANAAKIGINPLGSAPPAETKTWKKIQGVHGINECYNTVNPNYSTGLPEWRENCQKCVAAYEMRRRGFDVEAMPNLDNAGARWRTLGFKDMQWTPLAGTGRVGAKDLMQFWGDGARAIVAVVWQGGKTGYVFIAENDGGKIKYICPQTSNDKYKWASRVKEGYTEICRIDILEPADSIVECCKPR